MNSEHKLAVVVDGYSSGAGFAKELIRMGWRCVHVQSDFDIPRVYKYTFFPKDYEKNICFPQSPERNLALIQSLQPNFIIPGAESGVELADRLSAFLKLPMMNDPTLILARRHKFHMHQRLKDIGLAHIDQYCSNDIQNLIIWAQKKNTWPLVVKPVNSAGGEGISYCHTINEVRYAAEEILARPYNMLGYENKEVLIQEFLDGEELVVNTVNLHGKPYLCELWHYEKYMPNKNKSVYSTMRIIEYIPYQHDVVLEYAYAVMAALGIHNGPAHCEIKLTRRGPVLVECAARVMGANLPFRLLNACVSKPQAIMNLLAYTHQALFLKRMKGSIQKKKKFIVVFLIAKQMGKVRAYSQAYDSIKKLDSFFSIKPAVIPGDILYKTVDYETCPGIVYLCHQDRQQLEADFTQLRSIEEKGLFLLTKETDVITEAINTKISAA